MSKLQEKLYNQEVTPPPQVWNRIAAELDESHLDNSFPATLYNAAATPPPGAWDNITAGLDEARLSDKLYNAEAIPPATTWAAIAASLDSEQDDKVVPIARNNNPVWRYLVAALLIGIVAFGAVRFLSTADNEQNETLAGNTKIDSSKKTTSPVSTPAEPATAPGETIAATQPDNSTTLLAAVSSARKEKRTASGARYASNQTEGENSNPIYAYNEVVRHPSDRYIVLFKPDGNFIRMSKKWGDMLCCVAGEEESDDCKDQLQKWQEKMAEAPVAPSPGNFLDILTLVNTLNESDL